MRHATQPNAARAIKRTNHQKFSPIACKRDLELTRSPIFLPYYCSEGRLYLGPLHASIKSILPRRLAPPLWAGTLSSREANLFVFFFYSFLNFFRRTSSVNEHAISSLPRSPSTRAESPRRAQYRYFATRTPALASPV